MTVTDLKPGDTFRLRGMRRLFVLRRKLEKVAFCDLPEDPDRYAMLRLEQPVELVAAKEVQA